jgi:hypothetical protein
MIISDLFERASLISKLSVHAHDPDVFVTFVDVLKLGINPMSEWDHPVGVYFYPVSEIISGKAANNGHMIPFAAQRPYAFLVRAKGNMLELQDYTVDDLDRDIERIERKFPVLVEDREQWDHMVERWYAMWGDRPGEAIWRITERIANFIELRMPARSSRMIWHQLFRACGYDGVVDRGEKIISPNEPAQGVIFDVTGLTVLEAAHNDLITRG